jgi:hypothetical protein
MSDLVDVGSSPTEESCAQVGSPGYYEKARRECRAYIQQLRREFGAEPEGARLAVKANAHDFGTYLSVVCHYDPLKPTSIYYAFRCESESPVEWDAAARRELGQGGRDEKT